jgi:hypothetical protein
VNLNIDVNELRPLITEVVREVLAQLDAQRRQVPQDQLAFSEARAAQLLQMQEWQLRDERREGKIACSQVRGRRIRYSRQDLLDYLAGRRFDPVRPARQRAPIRENGSP